MTKTESKKVEPKGSTFFCLYNHNKAKLCIKSVYKKKHQNFIMVYTLLHTGTCKKLEQDFHLAPVSHYAINGLFT